MVVRHSRLKGLRAKNYEGDDEEWVQIVSYVFGQLDESAEKSTLLSGIESSASVIGSNDENKELVITIRNRIQTITVRAFDCQTRMIFFHELTIYSKGLVP
jgi:hypothetical protein